MAELKFLAIDFGAGSGRAIVGSIDRKLILEEIHRFPNTPVRRDGHWRWSFQVLFQELKMGLAKAFRRGYKSLDGIGVDTWGVDYGLIGKDGDLLEDPVTYRDERTEGTMEKVFSLVSRRELYRLTGIQFMPFNTIYQLMSLVDAGSSLLERCRHLLFMPDLFHYFLTGHMYSEYTIASTSQLLNAQSRHWEKTLFDRVSLPIQIMAPIVQPGTIVGKLRKAIQEEMDVSDVEVIAPACHDTACAIAAVPAGGNDWAYLSSGTWSLLGVEADDPFIDEAAMTLNFTNEGGVGNRIRFLRNMTGLWLLEACRRKWALSGHSDDYADLMAEADIVSPFQSIIDPDDPSFLNPDDMPDAIRSFCRNTNQPVPENRGSVVRCILESLALKYRYLIDVMEGIRDRKIRKLHIVGGGCKNRLLNQMTADATGLEVIAGPVEATAAGNILVQAMAKGRLASLDEARTLIRRSFPLERFLPEQHSRWEDEFGRIKDLFS